MQITNKYLDTWQANLIKLNMITIDQAKKNQKII